VTVKSTKEYGEQVLQSGLTIFIAFEIVVINGYGFVVMLVSDV